MQSTDCCSVYPLALKGLGLKLESSPSLKSTEPQSALVSRSHANSGPVRSRQVVSWLLSTVYLRAPYCVLYMATPGRASPTLLEPGIRSAKDIYVMMFSLPALGRSWVQLLPKGMKSKRPVQGSFDISLESKSDGSRGDDSAPNHLSPAPARWTVRQAESGEVGPPDDPLPHSAHSAPCSFNVPDLRRLTFISQHRHSLSSNCHQAAVHPILATYNHILFLFPHPCCLWLAALDPAAFPICSAAPAPCNLPP
jgi:hypothetical protein